MSIRLFSSSELKEGDMRGVEAVQKERKYTKDVDT